jgi:hypothetical protein
MRIRIERSLVFNGSSFVIHIHGRGCHGQKESAAVDGDGLRYAGRHLLRDRRVPVVQQVVHAGLGDACDVSQAPDAERPPGGSEHELAEEVAVGQAQAVSQGHLRSSTSVDVDT